jgi:spermidine synthase
MNFNLSKEVRKNLIILIAMALSGAAALIYEVVASQSLLYFFSANTYSVATVLSSFLFGLALGSLVMSKLLPRIRNKRLAFVIIEFIIGAYALLFLIRFETLPIYLINSNISGFVLVLAKFIVSFVYLLIPTLLLGMLFPLASSLLIKKVEKAGSDVGLLYSFDTFGAIIGAFAAGFLLIPMMGLTQSILLGGILSFLAGLLIIEKQWKKISIYATGCLLIALLFTVTVYTGKEKSFITGNAVKSINKSDIIFEKNSPYGVVTVVKNGDFIDIYTGKVGQCNSLSYPEARFAGVILEKFDRKINVLHIGLGCGFTLKGILQFDNVKEVDVVEINPAIVEATKKYFSEYNNNALEDERVNLFIEDGANFVRRIDKKYDAIILTVQVPEVIHSSPLYTVEYFKIMGSLLKEDGIFITYLLSDYEPRKILYFSLKEAFPHVYFRGIGPDMIIGSNIDYDFDLSTWDYNLLNNLQRETSYQLNTLDNPILSKFTT